MSLRLENIYFRYPKSDKNIINDISLSLKDGEIVTLLGPNGAGKTTLIKLLTSNLKKEGNIFLDDRELSSLKADERISLIGYLPQENSKLSSLSVFEVVLLGDLNHLGVHVKKEQLEYCKDILKQFNLLDIANKKYNELSGGQRKIVSIAQIMLKKPKVLILDEPTANLDVYNEIEVLSLVKEYVKSKNITCLLVLHSINLASRYSDKIVLLKDGSIYKEGSPLDAITEENLLNVYHVHVEKTISKNGYPLIHILENDDSKNYNFQNEN